MHLSSDSYRSLPCWSFGYLGCIGGLERVAEMCKGTGLGEAVAAGKATRIEAFSFSRVLVTVLFLLSLWKVTLSILIGQFTLHLRETIGVIGR